MSDTINLILICLSALTFMILNKKFVKIFINQTNDLNIYLDWKWRNILTSLLHSFFVGFGVLYV